MNYIEAMKQGKPFKAVYLNFIQDKEAEKRADEVKRLEEEYDDTYGNLDGNIVIYNKQVLYRPNFDEEVPEFFVEGEEPKEGFYLPDEEGVVKVPVITKEDKEKIDSWNETDEEYQLIPSKELYVEDGMENFTPEVSEEEIDEVIGIYRFQLLDKQTKEFIEGKYSEIKQRSDVNDKEYWSAWLIEHFPTEYSSDGLYQEMFRAVVDLFENGKSYDEVLQSLHRVTDFADSEEEFKYSIALEQLFKVAIRQGWVQQCKYAHSITRKQLEALSVSDYLQIDEVIKSCPYMEYPIRYLG